MRLSLIEGFLFIFVEQTHLDLKMEMKDLFGFIKHSRSRYAVVQRGWKKNPSIKLSLMIGAFSTLNPVPLRGRSDALVALVAEEPQL